MTSEDDSGGADRPGESDRAVTLQKEARDWPLYYIFGTRTEGQTAFWVEIQGPNGPARKLSQGFAPEPITMHDLTILATNYDVLPRSFEDTPFRFFEGEDPEIETEGNDWEVDAEEFWPDSDRSE